MGFENGYFKASNNIFNLGLKPNQFTILAYLIRLGNGTCKCYPSMNNIVSMCNVSKSTVTKSLDELQSEGYITIVKGVRGNEYIINYSKIEAKIDEPTKKEEPKKEESTESQNLSISELLMNETNESLEKVNNAIEYAKSKNADDVLCYARFMLKNGHLTNTPKRNTTNRFNSFPQREYSKDDFADMERRLLSLY